MMNAKLQKTVSYQSYCSLKETISHINDANINEALSKVSKNSYFQFCQLNSLYHIESETHPFFNIEDKKDQFNRIRKKGRVDGFTIMAQLRHLENVAEISKAEQEKIKRNIQLKKQANSIRRKNKWKKAANTLNQPYLVTYKNWIKQKSEQNDPQSIFFEKESEEQNSLNNSKPSVSEIKFEKQLKPYKKFVQFTKNKIRLKKQMTLQSSTEISEKAKSMDHLKSPTYKKYYKQYSDLAKRLAKAQERQRSNNDKQSCISAIIQKQTKRIFRKSNEKNPFEIPIQEKFSKLIKTQQNILKKSITVNGPLEDEARRNLKQKFDHINSQIFRTSKPGSQKNSRIRLTRSDEMKRSRSAGEK